MGMYPQMGHRQAHGILEDFASLGSLFWPAPFSLYGQRDCALTSSVEVLLSRAYVLS